MKPFSRKFLAIFLLSLPAVSHAWWNNDWEFRKSITVDASALELPAQPLLIRLHPGNFTFFADLRPNGEDLRFIAGDDKTLLKHHVEKYDPANGMALIWVQLPAENAKGGRLFMYYGNSKAPRAEDASGTYDLQYAAVYHFAASAFDHDQTSYDHRAEGVSAQPNSASIIGEGARFDGRGSIRIGASPTLAIDPSRGWTWSAWVRIESPQRDAVLLDARDGDRSIILGVNETAEARYTTGGKLAKVTGSSPLSTGAWHHVAVALGAGGLTLYIDGAAAGTAPAAPIAMQPTIVLGAASDGSHGFVGDMDEVEISSVARGAAWLAAQSRIQGVDAAALTYGNDESRDNGSKGSYFKVILQNVTVDGWVVIVLLAIMAAISWVVMAVKGLVIARTRKDDRAFAGKFRAIGAGTLTALDSDGTAEEGSLENSPFSLALFGGHDHFQSSTLYRLYHTGCQELSKRTVTAVGAQASSLSPQALDAIRASIDATLVRETQKLNGQMVLLTIAISGGPFLGLLGTVVGVMITFAAIAASGDVNVNAIAPGIAAALVATVAGLAVAIPALFGYNYLASRIKEITADMRVFVDEFMTRLAEYHS
jgi:biopolymer transport protein ExbB